MIQSVKNDECKIALHLEENDEKLESRNNRKKF